MVKFPKHFVQLTKLPGYYWNTEEKHLYSIKMTGVLHKLTKSKGFCGFVRGSKINSPPGWRISKEGWRRTVTTEDIEKMVEKESKQQIFPMEK